MAKKSDYAFFGAKPETDPKIKCRTCVLQPIKMCLFLFGLFGPIARAPRSTRVEMQKSLAYLFALIFKSPTNPFSNSSAKLPKNMFHFLARGTSKKKSKFIAELVWWFEGMVFVTPVLKNRSSTLTRCLFGSRVLKMACCLTWGGVFMTRVLKSSDLGPGDGWFSWLGSWKGWWVGGLEGWLWWLLSRKAGHPP